MLKVEEKVTGGQMRAARVLLRWTAEELAERSGVGLATIKRAEATGDGPVRMMPANAAVVQRTLEEGGIVFIPANGGGEGLRLRERRT